VRTIEDLVTFGEGVPAEQQIKTLVYTSSDGRGARFLLVLLRGDHQLHETKLNDALAGLQVRPAHGEEIFGLLGANAGSLGAVGAKKKALESGSEVFIIADLALRGRHNMTTGANIDNYHIRGVDVARDIKVDQWADLRAAASGEGCPQCSEGKLEVSKALEIGHIFKLGTKYSVSMGANVLTQDGREVPIVMGSYGIGVERIMASAIELHHDEDGIIWPKSIAPFDAIVTVTNAKQDNLLEAGERLYQDLKRAGLEVLLDDRDERAGVKFKDADLIGIPYRLTIGKKIGDGIVELFERRSRLSEDVKVKDVVERVQRLALTGQ
jgi:prolyl-tRNA synthetase